MAELKLITSRRSLCEVSIGPMGLSGHLNGEVKIDKASAQEAARLFTKLLHVWRLKGTFPQAFQAIFGHGCCAFKLSACPPGQVSGGKVLPIGKALRPTSAKRDA